MEGKSIGYDSMGAEGFRVLTSVLAHISHDFSNLLTPLLSYPALVRADLPAGAMGHELLDVIDKTAQDMAHITTQLQMLSYRDKGDSEDFNVNAVLQEVGIGLRDEAGSPDVVVETELGKDLLPICGSVDDILASVINLGHNALEAVGAVGTVCLRSSVVTLPEGTVAGGDPSPAGSFVAIAVSDTGTGIPERVKDTLFEPFVTTKNSYQKRGCGLGLTIVFKVMRDHGGRLTVESTPDVGTTVTMLIPVAC